MLFFLVATAILGYLGVTAATSWVRGVAGFAFDPMYLLIAICGLLLCRCMDLTFTECTEGDEGNDT